VTDETRESGGLLRRLGDRAKRAAGTLKDEYRKGLDGDDSPVQQIGPTAVDVIKAWMAHSETDDETPDQGAPSPSASETAAAVDAHNDMGDGSSDDTDDVGAVADLLGRADWRKVSAAVRDSQATQRMRDLASQVDWDAAKPVAARVASALIAAAAAGELGGLQGSAGRYVARTIANEAGLAEKVAQRLAQNRTPPSRTLARYIDTTATEVTGAAFDANLADIERLGNDPS